MDKIFKIVIYTIVICGLYLLAMYLYGFVRGWLEVVNDDSVSVYKAHVIHNKLNNMKNPIIKTGYDRGLRTNNSYSSASLEARLDDLDAAARRLKAISGWF